MLAEPQLLDAGAHTGRSIWDEAVPTPFVFVDDARVDDNIARMARHVADLGVGLRPHIKTHKSPDIGRRQLEAGACGITVAKLAEAVAFADAGITASTMIAQPFAGAGKVAAAVALAQDRELLVCLDDIDLARAVGGAAAALGTTLDVVVIVDTGYRRFGLRPEEIGAMAVAVAGTPGLRVAGVRSYGGRLYSPMPAEDARELAIAELVELAQAARDITAEGLPCRVVSAGSTPLTAALRPGDVPQEVTEIRAGNYVFYDRMQLQLHSAGVGDVALRLVATIVSVADDHAMVDAGLKSISATKAYADQDIAEIESRPGWRVDAAWEECARVRYPVGERPRAGDRLALIPNHACELPNLAAVVLHGRDDRIAGHYVPAARGEPW